MNEKSQKSQKSEKKSPHFDNLMFETLGSDKFKPPTTASSQKDPLSTPISELSRSRPRPIPENSGSSEKVYEGTRLFAVHTWNYTTSVRCIAISPTNNEIVVGTLNKLHVYHDKTAKTLYTFEEKCNHLNDVVYSGDGRHLLGSGGLYTLEQPLNPRGILRLYDPTARQTIQSWETQADPTVIRFSEDGRLIGSGVHWELDMWLKAGEVQLYDRQIGNRLGVLEHDGVINGIEFSHDGRRMVTVSESMNGGQIRVYDLERQATLQNVIRITSGMTKCICFSEDDRVFVVGCDDGHARLYETTSLSLLYVWSVEGSVDYVRFSLDGKWVCLGVSGRKNCVKLFDLKPIVYEDLDEDDFPFVEDDRRVFEGEEDIAEEQALMREADEENGTLDTNTPTQGITEEEMYKLYPGMFGYESDEVYTWEVAGDLLGLTFTDEDTWIWIADTRQVCIYDRRNARRLYYIDHQDNAKRVEFSIDKRQVLTIDLSEDHNSENVKLYVIPQATMSI